MTQITDSAPFNDYDEELDTLTVPCEFCNGTGLAPEGWDCEECDGLGYWND